MHDEGDAGSMQLANNVMTGSVLQMNIDDRYVGPVGVQPLIRVGAGHHVDHIEAATLERDLKIHCDQGFVLKQ